MIKQDGKGEHALSDSVSNSGAEEAKPCTAIREECSLRNGEESPDHLLYCLPEAKCPVTMHSPIACVLVTYPLVMLSSLRCKESKATHLHLSLFAASSKRLAEEGAEMNV